MTRQVPFWVAALLALSWTRAAGTLDLGLRATAKEVARDDGNEDLPVPQIRHFKTPGLGYTKESPMYRLQQAIKAIVGAEAEDASRMPATTMRCIIALTAQFFVVYTVYFIVQALNKTDKFQLGREEKISSSVANTVYFVPMLCILFVAVRLRAVQISHGNDPETYGLPQWWVKVAMILCVWSMFAHTVLVWICTTLYGEMWEAAAKKKSLGKICVFFKNLVLFFIYASFTTVCIGICTMQPPASLWGADKAPPVSPAVVCTIFLSVLYFAVYLASACARAVNESALFGPTVRFDRTQELLKGATSQVAFAPMLCVLFVSARLRALQLDSVTGNPQRWVQTSFYVCTVAVLAQTLLAVASGAIGMPVADVTDDGRYDTLGNRGNARSTASKPARVALEVFTFLSLACLYTGVVVIMVGLTIMEPSDDSAASGPLPTSLRCVIALTNLFFFVYCAIWIRNCLANWVKLSPKGEDTMAVIKVFLEARAKEAVSFCPMFSVLFIAAFIRALQLTKGKGAPQRWCQWFMCLATWSIFFLTVSRVDAVLPQSKLAHVCTRLQYICLGILYVCAVAVVGAMFTMSAENATGSGSLTKLGL